MSSLSGTGESKADPSEIKLSIVTDSEANEPRKHTVGPDSFERVRMIGKGAVGRVFLVKAKFDTGDDQDRLYAMKMISKSDVIARNKVRRVMMELDVLRSCDHPFIIKLYWAFQDDTWLYFVLQYCQGGEFFRLLQTQPDSRIAEPQAKFYAAELLLALEYLHVQGFIYRDLKPENVLVHESGHILLTDFDLSMRQTTTSPKMSRRSRKMTRNKSTSSPQRSSNGERESEGGGGSPRSSRQGSTNSNINGSDSTRATNGSVASTTAASHRPSTKLDQLLFCCRRSYAAPDLDTESHLGGGNRRTSFVGTVEYMAPEVIEGSGYAGTCDWWTLGILLYEMLHSDTPFKADTEMDTFINITDDAPLSFARGDVKLSLHCRQLLSLLLTKDMRKRLQTPSEIKQHPFFKDINWALVRTQTPPLIPQLSGPGDMTYHYEFTAEEEEELGDARAPPRPVSSEEADFSDFHYIRTADDTHWDDVSSCSPRRSSAGLGVSPVKSSAGSASRPTSVSSSSQMQAVAAADARASS